MKLQLSDRQLDILKMITSSYSPIEVETLIEKYGKSERSIRYDLKQIKTELLKSNVELKYKYKQGYYLTTDQKVECLKVMNFDEQEDSSDFMLETEKERHESLFLYLFTKSSAISADDIANHFFVSRSTILRTIKEVDFKDDDINIKAVKAQGYILDGNEYLIRKKFVACLFEKFRNYYSTKDWYAQLPNEVNYLTSCEDIENIAYTIKKYNSKYNVWINNNSFVKMIAYCIAYKIRSRFSKSQNYIKNTEQEVEKIEFAKDLLIDLSHSSQILESELEWMLMILSETDFLISSNNHSNLAIDDIVQRIVAYLISLNIDLNFDYQSLFNDLHDHLDRFIHLDANDLDYADKTIVTQIQSKYRNYYDLAIKCGEIFEKETNIELSETEISYIAIYLYKNSSNKTVKRKRILVVCGTGKGVSHLISIRINNIFPDIEVVGQLSPYQLNTAEINNIDFIVSTLPFNDCPCPVIKVSSVLSKTDIYRIQNMMEYGCFVDSLPFNINNPASLFAEEFNDNQNQLKLNEINSFVNTSTVISELILSLIEVCNSLPNKYQVGHQSMLGLIIHLSIAIPRWFTAQYVDDDKIECLYAKMAADHQEVYVLLEKYFSIVEKDLNIILSKSEKYAFYLYVIEEENNEKSSN